MSLIQLTKEDYNLKELTDSKNDATDKCNIITEIIPSTNSSSEDYVFLDKEAKAEELNSFFANIAKNIFELSQKFLLNNGLTCPEFPPRNYDNRDDIFRPQPLDVKTVILTVNIMNEIRLDVIVYHLYSSEILYI